MAQAERLAAAGEQGRALAVEPLRPPGVHRAAYEPEIDRYAGAALMPLSESLFSLSSRIALTVLRTTSDTPARIKIALGVIASAAVALGDPAQVRDFCRRGAESWRTWSARLGFPERRLVHVERAARRNAERLAPSVNTLIRGSAAGRLRPWAEALSDAVPQWRAARRPGARSPTERGVLFSHVHMFHNRLGMDSLQEMHNYASLAAALESARLDRIQPTLSGDTP